MMRQFALIILALGLVFPAYPQTSTYQADLDALYALLQKTPSYKDQIKEETAASYEALYQSLRNDTATTRNTFDRYIKIARLLFPIRDNHLGFFQFPHAVLKASDYGNAAAIQQYRATAYFKDYPASGLRLDSLQKRLAKKPIDSLEGIYYYDSLLMVGLYRSGTAELTGVVLHTRLPQWEKGQVAIRLFEYQPQFFRAVYSHPTEKNLIYYSNEKFRNQSLVNSWFYGTPSQSAYKKVLHQTDYVNIPRHQPPFEFTSISPGIQYLRLGNFSADPEDMKVSQAFYGRIRDSLTAAHLIVDLRNNTGGADKVSNKFLWLIKKYADQGKVYVLINNGTMSQGEIFTLQLKKLSAVTTYGQTTMGTIAYGVNYGGMKKLPSGQYGAIMTDMRDHASLLQYENYGITPENILNNQSDWVSQVLKLINDK
jgi:hypothetical protein